MSGIDKATLRDVLSSWGRGDLTARQIHEWAEETFDALDDHELPREDPGSIPREVVSQLEILDLQLITPEDIPAIIEFLETPPGRELHGWERWVAYWDDLDMDARIESLKGEPYYSAHALPEKTYDRDEVH